MDSACVLRFFVQIIFNNAVEPICKWIIVSKRIRSFHVAVACRRNCSYYCPFYAILTSFNIETVAVLFLPCFPRQLYFVLCTVCIELSKEYWQPYRERVIIAYYSRQAG